MNFMSISNNFIHVKFDKRAYASIKFCKNLLQSFIDTYYVVSVTLIQLLDRGCIIELAHIASDLQKAI